MDMEHIPHGFIEHLWTSIVRKIAREDDVDDFEASKNAAPVIYENPHPWVKPMLHCQNVMFNPALLDKICQQLQVYIHQKYSKYLN